MDKELEELEKQFIFDKDMEHEDIKDLIGRILKMCKTDNSGFVIIRKSNLTIAQKIMLVLSARYLANKLQQKLNKDISILEVCKTKELANMVKEEDAVITARLKELKDDRKIISPGRGEFKIAPYAIKDFLTELEGAKN
jgi:tryptophanyl-tRNA synthetase